MSVVSDLTRDTWGHVDARLTRGHAMLAAPRAHLERISSASRAHLRRISAVSRAFSARNPVICVAEFSSWSKKPISWRSSELIPSDRSFDVSAAPAVPARARASLTRPSSVRREVDSACAESRMLRMCAAARRSPGSTQGGAPLKYPDARKRRVSTRARIASKLASHVASARIESVSCGVIQATSCLIRSHHSAQSS